MKDSGAQVLCLAAGIAAAECQAITGDYRVGEPPGAGGASAAAPDAAVRPLTYGWVPGIPDEGFVEGCTACAQQECLDERNLCLDPAHGCWEWLECASQCKDPDCLQACESRAFVVRLACLDECGDEPGTVHDLCTADCYETERRFRALDDCLMSSKCTEPCNAGRNWDCVGEYVWQPGDANETVEIMVQVRDWNAPLPGVEVTFCGLLLPCPNSYSAAKTDHDGWASHVKALTFTGRADLGIAGTPLEPMVARFVYLHPAPIVRSVPIIVRMFSPDRLLPVHLPTIDTSPPMIFGYSYDCLLDYANGVRVSMDLAGTASPPVVYWHSAQVLDDEATDGTGLWLAASVDPGIASLTVSRDPGGDGERIVSEMDVPIVPGVYTIAKTFPAARGR